MTESHPVYAATVSAPTNIAVIKYWGKASVEYNTPINSSLSVTLDQADLRAVTTVAVSKQFTRHRLWLNGIEETPNARFLACVHGVQALAQDKYDSEDTQSVAIAKEEWPQLFLHVSSYNTFPTAAGLASSAAGYAALVAALVRLMNAKEDYPGQFTTIARQGSGSASRSLYGGLVAWRMGSAEQDWRDSKAEQIVSDWPSLKALILVVSDQKKDTSSTSGMKTSVQTSALLKHRAEVVVPERMKLMEQACRDYDFATFGRLTMQDSNQFHATCLDTYPPIFYMNDISKAIVRLTTMYNAWADEPVRAAYTFDAGPNAVIYCLEPHAAELAALMLHYFPGSSEDEQYLNDSALKQAAHNVSLDAKLLELCDRTGREPRAGDVKKMYYTQPGPGPQVLTDVCNLNPVTGLNSYVPNGNH